MIAGRKHVIIIAALFLLVLSGCGSGKKKYAQTRVFMGTFVSIDICSDLNKDIVRDAMNAAWQRIGYISEKMSVYDPSSDISSVNNSFPDAITVDDELYRVISMAKKMNLETSGAFDVTIGPLVEMWKRAYSKGNLPSKEEMSKNKSLVGSRYIKLLRDNKIKLEKQGLRLDLGGIAKGYAVDIAAKAIKERGFNDFFVEAGGDIYVSGNNCNNKKWRVGVKDPRDKKKVIDVIGLSNSAVTTSGDYERFFEINGKKYSHIIDPVSGYPQRGVISATVIAPTTSEADALSTAVCVLGKVDGIKLIESLGDTYSCLVVEDSDDVNKLKTSECNNYNKFQLN